MGDVREIKIKIAEPSCLTALLLVREAGLELQGGSIKHSRQIPAYHKMQPFQPFTGFHFTVFY